MKIHGALTIFLSAASLLSPTLGDEIMQIHGSGTTNPSKCIWGIMSKFNARSRDPIRMTYRAVGSSTGQAEFLGRLNTNNGTAASHWPHVDFGAGDIPISEEEYDALNDEPGGVADNLKMVHLPFALSSVSFFYNLNGADKIDLGGCLLAKIFNRKITQWNDPEIVEVNPALAKISTPITVCRRTHGSSSTKSITQFLYKECEAEWSYDQVGSELTNWDDGTTAVEGSGQMVECINEANGAIGYLESGHGWAESLQEISLQNLDGNYVTSKEAYLNGGITGAASEAMTPINAAHDWSKVDFIDKGGKGTYPIVLMSYIYVRRELYRYIQHEEERGLLKLFLEAFYKPEYFEDCHKLGFSHVPTSIREVAIQGINGIEWAFTGGENMWKFEIDTEKLIGSRRYTISSKRRSYQGVELEDILAMDEMQKERVNELFQLAELELGNNLFTDHHLKQLDNALILSAISFALWCAVIIGW
eukprot:CAMPEP_0203682888 /NCGR_PEP_ID=MMETSP0090-20130426/47220_1 /ASSEMBLY_ACC=CAM_ASM_001088 /TAXON_ID=426623 /ORGANISM="Chaetoceros affinis, Strain CCMP159" /LENGTH=474 /DNA_ID=CAMNT_0050552005 /DNA_START=42 /DNA_END=1463 /DNA_ORIENTATION=+